MNVHEIAAEINRISAAAETAPPEARIQLFAKLDLLNAELLDSGAIYHTSRAGKITILQETKP